MGVPDMTTSWEGQKHHASVGRRAVSEAHAAREILSPPPLPDASGRGRVIAAAKGPHETRRSSRASKLQDALHSAQGREKHASIRRAEAQQARELYVNSLRGASL